MPDTVKVDKTPEEAQELAEKAARKAKLAQVLNRGAVSDRLDVKDADPGRHYEWCRNTEVDVARWKALGFEIEYEKGKDSKLHGTGDGRIVVGDAVLVSTSKENHEAIEEVKDERRRRRREINAKKDYVQRMRRMNPQVPVLDPLNEGAEGE